MLRARQILRAIIVSLDVKSKRRSTKKPTQRKRFIPLVNRHVDLNWRKKVTFYNIGQNSCIILFRQK